MQASTVVIERANTDVTDVKVKPQAAWKNVLVRAARTGLQSFVALGSILLVGTLTVDMQNYEQWLEVTFLMSFGKKVLVCLVVALVTVLWSAVQNTLEILNRVDEKVPQARG